MKTFETLNVSTYRARASSAALLMDEEAREPLMKYRNFHRENENRTGVDRGETRWYKRVPRKAHYY